MAVAPTIAHVPPQPEGRQRKLKEDFIARRGYWTPWLDGTLRFSPDFFEAFLAFTGAPWANGPLPPKVKEFVYIAIDGAITHLYRRGLEMHITEALRHGASAAEVMEVLQMSSLIGLITSTVAAPMLLEALHGGQATSAPLDDAQLERKHAFEQATGHWDEGCEAMLRLDPHAFDTYAGYIRSAWQTRALDPVTRELIGIAVHASTTLLHAPGIKLHMQRAVALGATSAQIMEVLQLTSVLGIHTCSVGVPLLMEALASAA